jgi:hypothetical protein
MTEKKKSEYVEVDLTKLKTSELIDLGHNAPDDFWDYQGVDWWTELRSRCPFEQFDNDYMTAERVEKRLDDIWKAIRTHHHVDGKVVREV